MNKKGFTLIEVVISIVLVSVVLISLLATLVKLRETYTVIHENTDVLVYNSSITRVINNDFVNNNGVRYITCDANGELCTMTLGNDKKRELEIRRDTTTRTETSKVVNGKQTPDEVTIENIKTTLKYSDTTKYDKTGDEKDKELIYIKTLTLERAINNRTKVTTTEGYSFNIIEAEQYKYKKNGTNLIDLLTTIRIKLDDGKSTELTRFDILLYASGRYDESKLIGRRYSIALDYGDEATTSGTTSIDQVYGVAYYEIDPITASESRITKITIPTRTNYAFLGYYYKRGSAVEEMVIDSTGEIIADPRTFEENVTKDLDSTSRVYAVWHDCTNYPGYEVINGICTPKKYTVTLDRKEGKEGTTSYIATYQAWVPKVEIPKRGGYIFTGYKSATGKTYHDKNGEGTSVYDIPDASTFIAGWEKCPAGKYSSESMNTCEVCPAGTYSLAGASECIPCSAGYYQSSSGQSSCNKCPVGQYQDKTGATSCKNCTAGTYQNEEGATSCKSCAAGKYQNEEGKTSCKNCSAGTYQPSTGQTSCIACAAGKYQDATGKTSCKNCEAGKYQDATGQSSCKNCVAGKYQNETGKTSCKECEAGTYQDKTGSSSCKNCNAGTYQPNTGQTTCINCVIGSTSPTKATACTACQGLTTSSSGQSTCNSNCSNAAHVATWNTATWNTNNTVNDLCSIKKCENFYKLENGYCVSNQTEWTFEYNNSYHTFVIPYSGKYSIELWGAQGGAGSMNGTPKAGGAGGYTTGIINLSENTTLYIYVGGMGGSVTGFDHDGGVGGYNGGARGGANDNDEKDDRDEGPGHRDAAGGGGGATDIRTGGNNLENRIMVAGGGGGGSYGYIGDCGNGTTVSGTLGVGQNGCPDRGGSGGGGGGYYGGKTQCEEDGRGYGGSGYANNSFKNITITKCGRNGNGYAKIRYLEE